MSMNKSHISLLLLCPPQIWHVEALRPSQCDQVLEFKVAQLFPNVAQFTATGVLFKDWRFTKFSKKLSEISKLLLKENLTQRPLKNCPIWSHWAQPRLNAQCIKLSAFKEHFCSINVSVMEHCCCCCAAVVVVEDRRLIHQKEAFFAPDDANHSFPSILFSFRLGPDGERLDQFEQFCWYLFLVKTLKREMSSVTRWLI